MPSCSSILIDKLAVTIPLSDSAFEHAYEALSHNDSLGPLLRSPYFRITRLIHLSPACSIVISIYPTRQGLAHPSFDPEASPDLDIEPPTIRNRFRIEWNPSKMALRRELHSQFIHLLSSICGPEFRDEFRSAVITRIDLATDIHGVGINQLVFSRNDTSVHSAIYYGRDGKPETIYLGEKQSDLRFVIYDKRKEAKKRRIYRQEITRVEARVKHRIRITDLFSISNPFAKLSIREFCELENESRHAKYNWRWLVDSMRVRGQEAALNLVPIRSRHNWNRRILETEGPQWWNPEEIWLGLNLAITQINLWDDIDY